MKTSLVVAALLLTASAGIAAAAESPEHLSKNAQKLLATLEMIGINSQEVKDMVARTNARIDKKRKYFYLNEQKAGNGMLSLRYALGNKPSVRQLELAYEPKDSHFSVTARTNIIFVGYHFELQ